MPKQTKVITKRKKFQEVEIPIINSNVEIIGNSLEELKDKLLKLDLTRQLRGKSLEAVFKISIMNNKLIANPVKIKLMPYFIRRMIRKRISYVEDSFLAKSQDSLIIVKPFLITRKRVSRAVRKALRNRARNWLEDYLSQKTDSEIFNDIFSNKLQKPLSLVLKKTYPLSLCEIRILEIKRPLEEKEKPQIEKKAELKEEVFDQLAEIEEERIKEAELAIKETQKKAAEIEEEIEKEEEKTEEKETKNVKKEIQEEEKEKSKKEVKEKKTKVSKEKK